MRGMSIMKKLKIRVTMTEELLGTCSNNPDIHAEFIASKAPDASSRDEEIEAFLAENGLNPSAECIHLTR